MEYLIVVTVFFLSSILAYFIMKKEVPILTKILVNAVALCITGAAMFATGLQETTFSLYILVLGITILGILMRVIAPVFLNLFSRVMAKIHKESYTKQSYNELMSCGHRMFFCVLTFTTLKILIYIALITSFFVVM